MKIRMCIYNWYIILNLYYNSGLQNLMRNWKSLIINCCYVFFYTYYQFLKLRTINNEKLLIIRLDEIGDVVLSTPLLREIKKEFLHSQISLIVNNTTYNLVEQCPYVDKIIIFDKEKEYIFSTENLALKSFLFSLRHLLLNNYTLTINPRWDVDYYGSNHLTFFSGSKKRIGCSENINEHKSKINKGHNRFFSKAIDDKSNKHEVLRNLDIIKYLGSKDPNNQLELWITDEDKQFALDIFKKNGISIDDIIISIGPSGGNSKLKQWPIEYFSELGKQLINSFNAKIVFIGGPGEESLGTQLVESIGENSYNFIGKTTLRQLAAICNHSNLYIGNDSGPMHIATAMQIPVIAIFGSSCHKRFGPWSNKAKVIYKELDCKPYNQNPPVDRCRKCIYDSPKCLEEISVSQVEQEVNKILKVECQP